MTLPSKLNELLVLTEAWTSNPVLENHLAGKALSDVLLSDKGPSVVRALVRVALAAEHELSLWHDKSKLQHLVVSLADLSKELGT